MFQLLEDEYDSLRSQFVTLENGKGNHRKFLPTVFTEYGAVMLSGILNSDRAIEVNVTIVKAFVELRRKLNTRPALEEWMGQLERKVDQIDQKYDRQSQKELLNTRYQNPRPENCHPPSSDLTSQTDRYLSHSKTHSVRFQRHWQNLWWKRPHHHYACVPKS